MFQLFRGSRSRWGRLQLSIFIIFLVTETGSYQWTWFWQPRFKLMRCLSRNCRATAIHLIKVEWIHVIWMYDFYMSIFICPLIRFCQRYKSHKRCYVYIKELQFFYSGKFSAQFTMDTQWTLSREFVSFLFILFF